MGIDMDTCRRRAMQAGKESKDGYPKVVPAGLGLLRLASSKEEEKEIMRFAFWSSALLCVVAFISVISLPIVIIWRFIFG